MYKTGACVKKYPLLLFGSSMSIFFLALLLYRLYWHNVKATTRINISNMLLLLTVRQIISMYLIAFTY